MVQHYITLITLAFKTEKTWAEAMHSWVLVDILVVLRGSDLFEKSTPDNVSGGQLKGVPSFHQDQVHLVR